MNAQALKDEGIDLERGTKAVDAILHPQTTVVNAPLKAMNLKPEPYNESKAHPEGYSNAPAPTPKPRATRSDKGKPRESVFLTIPGVRFDLATDAGREAFLSWVSGALASEGAHQMIPAAVEQLLGHIDRLREQGK